MTLEHGYRLWKEYNERLISLWHNRKFPILCFDASQVDYLAELNRAAIAFGLPPHGGDGHDQFFDEGLRSAPVPQDNQLLPTEVADLYRQLYEIYSEGQLTSQ